MHSANDRLILHCDLNNFYASVECVEHPEWKNVPLAVAGNPDKRHGVILAKNELAKKKGIKTGDTIWQAKQKEPALLCVPPHFSEYMRYSKQAFEIYTRFTSQVEPFGPDECWLDVTASTRLFGTGKQIADAIRETVKKETGLTLSAGVSFNKVFAKMASDLHKPDATTLVMRTSYRKVLWPLPVSDMLMVGKRTAEKLQKLNIFTVGDLAAADRAVLRSHFGVMGEKLHEYANGQDNEPVREYVQKRAEKSVGHGMTATRDLNVYADAEALITYLSDKVAQRMRKQNVRASGVALGLRSFELKHITRQKILPRATCAAADIRAAAVTLLHENWSEDPPLRTVTVSAFDLSRLDAVQMGMFDDTSAAKAENLEKALDAIRRKYGEHAVYRAGIEGADFIYDKNDDEDFLPFQR
ncbi:MAG: DNA polymerase IV [Clostridia bacterium]|nr:DNA polymerase IV [Clostridia bacterium]